jgi:hypothetical protein
MGDISLSGNLGDGDDIRRAEQDYRVHGADETLPLRGRRVGFSLSGENLVNFSALFSGNSINHAAKLKLFLLIIFV